MFVHNIKFVKGAEGAITTLFVWPYIIQNDVANGNTEKTRYVVDAEFKFLPRLAKEEIEANAAR
jgi:hypothetical protein